MKGKMKITALSVFMALVLTVSACASGGGGSSSGNTVNFGDTIVKANEEEYYDGGVHVFNKRENGKYLVKDGKSDYKIVIPTNADRTEVTAASELQNLLAEASGVYLPTVNESALSGNEQIIALGKTDKYASVEIPDELNSNGYIIKTVGNDVVIKAEDSHGVLWGVYEFLTQTTGYECVSYDTWTFDCKKGEVKLYDFDIKDSPDYEFRIVNTGVIYNDEVGSHKMRWLLPHQDIYIQGNGIDAYHNYFQYVGGISAMEEHPKWFSDDGTQLCLTAHGDDEERELMIETIVEKMKEIIDADSGRKILGFTQEDIPAWCTCETCSAYYRKYKTDAGVNIIFVNELARRIKTWLDEERGGREILIHIFAYMKTQLAPSVKGENGEWLPIDEDVMCEDNVAVMIAPVYDQMAHGIDQPENISVQESVLGWKAVCKNFGYWGYCTYYTDDIRVMHPSYMATQNTYRYLLNNVNPVWIFDQGQSAGNNHTGFVFFKCYLQSQWGWDVNRDYRTLKEKFFKGYFGNAADAMEKYFDGYSTIMYNALKLSNTGSNVWTTVCKTEYFPLPVLKEWLSYIDQAKEALEVYKTTNPELYEKLYSHVEIESVSVTYILLKLYSGRFSASELEKIQSDYDAIVSKYGVV